MSHVAKRYHPVDEKPSQATDALSVNMQTASGVRRSGRSPVPFGTGRPSRSHLGLTFRAVFCRSVFCVGLGQLEERLRSLELPQPVAIV